MTKLEELNTDLACHEASLEKLYDSKHAAHWLKYKKIDVNLLIPSYIKIIKSIKDEIALIESKKKPKAKKAAKTVAKKTPKK